MTFDHRGGLTLVTGASAGIGAEFARRLAGRGSDLVIVARREDRLKVLAAEIEAAHGVAVTVLPCDLADPGAAAYLAGELRGRGLRLTGLVNNAGFATSGPFVGEDAARLRAEIAVDVVAMVELTSAFINDLDASGRGVLVNVASMAAYTPVPRMAVYGAAKAFVLSFTEALWQEHRGTGLRVLALSPGATRTEFFDIAGPQAATGGRLHTPDRVVETALRTLDRRDPPPSIAVGRTNRLMATLGRLASRRRSVMLMGALTARSANSG
ncbi:short-chain dehydrogenase/reductase SDR [Alloactinosynnema sp. L-07]|uniref:SDR family NAD(P)-dependent oxidoreductase n=1 Tax=Alloactinosynnema sp. L-07 TaxID=1653480 RepID=UPI00065F0B1D|nr:SDR family oxidoreductase [Alloactinosynnema sp. L-07]CRK61690.1 short-chain dehydrogenase/reductase SDR [Alloactinosynnema sp. L-07]